MSGGFIDQLVDWQDFEGFVRDLYAKDPSLEVEHNVTENGKSGAKRQIDVKFTHQAGGHTYVTLVECKRWKEKIDRRRIDELFASIEDLRASKGVMFTTAGYESGAETYAADKGIDLFVVRDLTSEEWGLPGRVVWFYWHLYAAEISKLDAGRASLLAIAEDPPKNVNLNLVISREATQDPALTLYTGLGGSAGPNLMSLVLEARQRTLEILSKSVGLLADGADGATKAFLVPVRLDLADQDHRHLLRDYGAIRLDHLSMELVVTIRQTRFEFDRGDRLDLALAVENYVTRQRRVVTREVSSAGMEVFGAAEQEDEDADDALQNGTLLRIFTEPWVQPNPKDPAQQTAAISFRLPSWEVAVANEPGSKR